MSLEWHIPNPLNPNVCDVFKAGARDTWTRICFSRRTPKLKIHETTISQNLVYEMNLMKHKRPLLNFHLFESTDENANGDDLELIVSHKDGSTCEYAIQSKIIYHHRKNGVINLRDGNYKMLKHWTGKGTSRRPQVDLLLDYAKKIRSYSDLSSV